MLELKQSLEMELNHLHQKQESTTEENKRLNDRLVEMEKVCYFKEIIQENLMKSYC